MGNWDLNTKDNGNELNMFYKIIPAEINFVTLNRTEHGVAVHFCGVLNHDPFPVAMKAAGYDNTSKNLGYNNYTIKLETSDPFALKGFFETAIHHFPDLAELRDPVVEFIDKFVHIPLDVAKKVEAIALTRYESAEQLALAAQAIGEFEPMTILLNAVSDDLGRWTNLVFKMDEKNPLRMELLQLLYDKCIDETSYKNRLVDLIHLSLLMKSEELNRFCAEYIGWELDLYAEPMNFSEVPFDTLMPILDKIKEQQSKIKELEEKLGKIKDQGETSSMRFEEEEAEVRRLGSP